MDEKLIELVRKCDELCDISHKKYSDSVGKEKLWGQIGGEWPHLYLLYCYVYLLYYVCIAVLTLDAGLLARSQYPEGPETGNLDTDFSWILFVRASSIR